MFTRSISRRRSWRPRGLGTAVLTAALVATPLAASADESSAAADPVPLTILATTDVHANVFNWDYFNNAPYATNQTGLAKVSTLVKQVRADRGAGSTLLLDNGDTFQGTPLAITSRRSTRSPPVRRTPWPRS